MFTNNQQLGINNGHYQFPQGTVVNQQAIFQGPNGSQTINYPLSTCIGRKKALLIGIR